MQPPNIARIKKINDWQYHTGEFAGCMHILYWYIYIERELAGSISDACIHYILVRSI